MGHNFIMMKMPFVSLFLVPVSIFANSFPMEYCTQRSAARKVVEASDLLSITPQNFDGYRKSVVTIEEKYISSEETPLEVGKRFEVSPKLPKFMLLRSTEDGIHEMRGFGAESRFFRRQVVNGKVEWIGVPEPKFANWKSPLQFEKQAAKVTRLNYSKINRKDLARQIAENAGEASLTVNNPSATNPARARAAAEGLHKASDYILNMWEKKQHWTLEKLEELHATVANGTIQTKNGDLGLGILRGSGPRCVQSDGTYIIADMEKTSVRMGEQKVMSYTAPQDVKKELQKLLDRVNEVNPKTSTSEVADIYTQFLAIHPFIDGNGRTSRMLLQHMQLKMEAPVTSLSKSAAFMAFYLKPTELSQIIFVNPQKDSEPIKSLSHR